MAKAIVINLVRTYALGKPEDLVQIDKVQSSIRAMHQIALIGKALNQMIWQVDMLGAYCHAQTMTVDAQVPTLQAWLPLEEEPLQDLNLILEAQPLNTHLFG
eukprot:14271800-Ditylum_brightwellii.AAC.1